MGKEKSSGGSFFQNLLAALFKSNDADAEKKRKLKSIAKRLSKSKYNKFYRYNGNEALPQMAKFFFDIYKAVSPAAAMFESMQNQNMFKRVVFNFVLTDEQKALEEKISEEYITEATKTVPLSELKGQVSKDLSKYTESFTAEKIAYIDSLYRQLIAFKDFCSYDYYFMLKKFDPSMRERDFSASPRFEKINAEYIGDDLKDFVTTAWALPDDADWASVFKMLALVKGKEPVSMNVWRKIIARLQTARLSGAFEMIIRLITADPVYVPQESKQTANIVEPYIDKMSNDATAALQKIAANVRESKANSLVEQLFGDAVVLQLKNYTEQTSAGFERKGLTKLKYCQPLNYLKAFLIEIIKKDMREYYDIVFVRGTWDTQALYTPVSNAYHELLRLSDLIKQFDDQIDENATIGQKIKTIMPRVDRDHESRNIVERLIGDMNDSARNFIMDASKNIIIIGKTLKNLIEDEGKQHPELIVNWKELEHFAENSDVQLREFGTTLYKKIYLFTCLMQTFASAE